MCLFTINCSCGFKTHKKCLFLQKIRLFYLIIDNHTRITTPECQFKRTQQRHAAKRTYTFVVVLSGAKIQYLNKLLGGAMCADS